MIETAKDALVGVSGSSVIIDRFDAIRQTAEYLESQGWTVGGASNQSEALYLTAPGYWSQLRIAAHSCRHGFQVAHSIEFTDSTDSNPSAFAYRVDNWAAADLIAALEPELLRYFEEAEEDDDDDDDE